MVVTSYTKKDCHTMIQHFRYLRYMLVHKWFVFLACRDRGLYWRGIVHDWHKFLPSEWSPYAQFFYGKKTEQVQDDTGYYKPTDTGDHAFDFAWLLHQKRADHHWQWWICPQDDGGDRHFPMSEPARLEMLCDWIGASMAQGYGSDVKPWYLKNCDKIRLHPETQKWVESELGYQSGQD